VIFALTAPTAAPSNIKLKHKRWRYFNATADVVKYELNIVIESVNAYVAPTFINMHNPTFWVSPIKLQPDQDLESKAPNNPIQNILSELAGGKDNIDEVMTNNENNLTRIMSVTNFKITMDFLTKKFVDHHHA
jgi:hypothetical protein